SQRAQVANGKPIVAVLFRAISTSSFEKLLQVAAYHHADHAIAGYLTAVKTACVAAIAKHHGAIGNLFDFVQPVRDIDDADIMSLEVLYDFEQAARFREREARRRLVHDQNARAG